MQGTGVVRWLWQLSMVVPVACGLYGASAWNARAAEFPEPVLPNGVGVNIHFVTGHENELDMIAGLGIKFVRMDFEWPDTETKRGEYDWSEYDQLTENLSKRGIRPYYILVDSNPLYERASTYRDPITQEVQHDPASPQHPESVAAFAKWAGAAAKHFAGRHVVWEIWNEPNLNFWKPKPDVAQYAALVLAAGKAIREADPQATLVGPATDQMPQEFIEPLFKAGVLKYLDGVSVHPYREKAPETAARDYNRLRELIDKYTPRDAKARIPIISGEWGYAAVADGGVSPETQAKYVARQQLFNLLENVPISIWYDWQNDGEDPKNGEHNFGLVTHDLKPKPAYVAMQTLTRELSGYRIIRRQKSNARSDFVLVMGNEKGEFKVAAWTIDKAHGVTMELETTSVGEVAAVSGDGKSSKLTIARDAIQIPLTDEPLYVRLGNVRVK